MLQTCSKSKLDQYSISIIYIVTITNISLLSTTTAGVFDPYIPPEGDARLSSLSKEGLKQRTEQIKQAAAYQLA